MNFFLILKKNYLILYNFSIRKKTLFNLFITHYEDKVFLSMWRSCNQIQIQLDNTSSAFYSYQPK